jgi:signal transduction histidine kinase
MQSLRWRLTFTHLLVSLLALLLVALLTPSLFFRYYSAAETKRWQNIAGGLARAAAPLLREGGDSPHLNRMIMTSAVVLAAEVSLVDAQGALVISSNREYARGQALPQPPFAPARMASYTASLNGGMIVIRKPVPGWEYLLQAQSVVLGLVSLAAATLALLLALVTSRAVTAPVVSMSAAAHELADGNFAISLDETGPTELRSLAASMNHMAASLASLDQLRREFIASASHELRAPLSSIRGFLGALQDGTAATEEARQRCLQAASAEAQRMTRLVEDLLQLSRLQAGVLEFTFQPTNLRALVEGVVHSFEARLRAQGLTTELELAEVPLVSADGERLVQVVVNLLDNALRYGPAGSSLRVCVAPDDDGVRVAVADQGPGIPESDLREIFERFHKADPARQVGDHGAGLGLAIAREIILRHGGEVFAHNRDGGGAEVVFRVPVRATPASA